MESRDFVELSEVYNYVMKNPTIKNMICLALYSHDEKRPLTAKTIISVISSHQPNGFKKSSVYPVLSVMCNNKEVGVNSVSSELPDANGHIRMVNAYYNNGWISDYLEAKANETIAQENDVATNVHDSAPVNKSDDEHQYTRYLWYVDDTCERPNGVKSGIVWDLLKKYSSPDNPISRAELRKKSKLPSKVFDCLEISTVKYGYFKRVGDTRLNIDENIKDVEVTNTPNDVDMKDIDIGVDFGWKGVINTLKEESPELFKELECNCKEAFLDFAKQAYQKHENKKTKQTEIQKLWDEIEVHKRDKNIDAMIECMQKLKEMEGEAEDEKHET